MRRATRHQLPKLYQMCTPRTAELLKVCPALLAAWLGSCCFSSTNDRYWADVARLERFLQLQGAYFR